MSIDRYSNPQYVGTIPRNMKDRRYSQDIIRDFWHLVDRNGQTLVDMIDDIPLILKGGDVEQGAGDTVNINSMLGYAKFSVEIPDIFTSLPPTKVSADIEAIRIEIPSDLTNQAVTGGSINDNLEANANLDGATTNYIKVQYTEINGNTRTKAKDPASYSFEVLPSYKVVIDTTAPTDSELLLATFTGLPAGTFTFDSNLANSSRTKQIAPLANKKAGTNFIVNSSMRFDLEHGEGGTVNIPATSTAYSCTTYLCENQTDAVIDVTHRVDTPNYITEYCLEIDVTTADATIAAAQWAAVRMFVEGYDYRQLHNGKDVAFGFWVKSAKTGIHCVSFGNSAGSRSYVQEYTVRNANVWEFKWFTLKTDTAGTWLFDEGRGIEISWTLAAGTNFHGTAGSWQGTGDRATSNQVNVLDTIGNQFHVSQPVFVAGKAVPVFELLDVASELKRIHRLYETSYLPTVGVGTATATGVTFVSGIAGSSAIITNGSMIGFGTRKRALPTVSTYRETDGSASTWDFVQAGISTGTCTPANQRSSVYGLHLETTNASGLTTSQSASMFGHWEADSRF